MSQLPIARSLSAEFELAWGGQLHARQLQGTGPCCWPSRLRPCPCTVLDHSCVEFGPAPQLGAALQVLASCVRCSMQAAFTARQAHAQGQERGQELSHSGHRALLLAESTAALMPLPHLPHPFSLAHRALALQVLASCVRCSMQAAFTTRQAHAQGQDSGQELSHPGHRALLLAESTAALMPHYPDHAISFCCLCP